MKKNNFLCFFFLLFFCGCSFFSKIIYVDQEIDSFENQRIVVQILKRNFLTEKKLFFVEPFKIGEEAEASVTIDHIVQTFQLGIEHGLKENKQSIVYDTDYADIIVRGVVEKFKKPSAWKRHLFFFKKEAELNVMLFFIDRKDSSVIAFSLGWNKMLFETDNIEQQSYQVGKDMVTEIFYDHQERDQ